MTSDSVASKGNVVAGTQSLGSQNTITLVSRAWNLMKANLKASIMLILPPILLLTGVNLLVSMLSGGTFLTTASPWAMGMKLGLALAGLFLLIPSFFLWVFCGAALSRLYFSSIVGDEPLSVRDCCRHVWTNWLTYTLLTAGLGLVSMSLMGINLLLLILGVFLSSTLMIRLGTALGHFGGNVFTGSMLVLFLLVWGFTILVATSGILIFQCFFFIFPLLSISTTPRNQLDWWPRVRAAYRLMFARFTQLMLFSLSMGLFSMVLGGVLMSPAFMWMLIELQRLGIGQQHHIPIHIQTVINIWSSLANLVIYPFQISACTLLWYDCQVRQEGLDLQIRFNRLLLRKGFQPADFNTLAEPQPG
jgi:hypothetical protein